MSQNLAKDVSWDLSDLYDSISSEVIENDISKLESKLDTLRNEYKELPEESFTAEKMISYLDDYAELVMLFSKLGEYSYLVFAKNKNNSKVLSFYQRINEVLTNAESKLVWHDIKINNISDEKFNSLISDDNLAKKYGYYLKNIRKFKPYLLSEAEEKIMTLKSQTGSDAFARLYEEISSKEEFEVEIDGEINTYDISTIRSLMDYHPSREVRENSSKAYTNLFKKKSGIYSFILNTLVHDRIIDRGIRGYKFPSQNAYLINDTSKEIVDSMEEAVENNLEIGHRYYKKKAEIMGIEKLHEWDRYAPIFDEDEELITWQEAKDIVLESFHKFDSEYGKTAEMFFDKRWIDAELAKGKSHGAFCTHGTPDLHPYILLNYTGKQRDVMTLAHELGHGIHHYMSRTQNILNFQSSTPVAEIASVFGESLVFDSLLNNQADEKSKAKLLANKIEDDMATVFRQMSFHQFEKSINKSRKEKGELSAEMIGELWQENLQKMFGKSLTLTDNHSYWWMPVLHFYHFDFYVYSYSFGQLLTLALYSKYVSSENKSEFTNKYKKVLQTGGSMSPKDLLSIIGIDIIEEGFWENGMSLLNKYVEDFESYKI